MEEIINLKIAAQNCQSLNISTKSDKTLKKILAVVKGGEDIIFLSDVKMNSSIQIHAVHDVEKKFNNLGYEFFHNSTTSTRGVGILIKKNKFKSVVAKTHDVNNNFLLLKVELEHGICLLGSVYGPNENDMVFFDDLNGIKNLECNTVILGGDWNCSWDPRPVEYNYDVIKMANIPSRQRSEKLNQIANVLNLTDPFRTLYPIKKEFTYIPNARINLNRSRIDFFLNQ
jgi:exonuclease III